ncbi:protein of unknown function [Streptantibioticus cattleyicolor NRRL 8057 = DSM 46488]|nr:protein of unknown function [Streptantibioticus cattleyicolor NRRL 8057 = DSM 46488]
MASGAVHREAPGRHPPAGHPLVPGGHALVGGGLFTCPPCLASHTCLDNSLTSQGD